MVSKSWKQLEYHVAEVLGGKRPSRSSWAESCPDVVVHKIIQLSAHSIHVGLIVECKYSQDQPWQRFVSELMDDMSLNDSVKIVTCEDLVIWDLEDTDVVLTDIFAHMDVLHLIKNYSVIAAKKKVPKYIRQMLGQVASYGSWVPDGCSSWIPLVCLAQKRARRRIIICNFDDLRGIDVKI